MRFFGTYGMGVKTMTDFCDKKSACDERFDKVYEGTFADVRRFVAVRCADPDDLFDVLQEIYLEYYRLLRRKGTDYPTEDRAIVFTIAERKVKRYYSLKQRLRRILPLWRLDDEETTDPVVDIPDPINLEELAMRKDEVDRIDRLLARYPAETRKIFYLYFAEELKLQEIATSMDLPLSTVKSRLYRTLRELKQKAEGS